MSTEKKNIDNIGDLSFDLLFGEEPDQNTLSSTKEEKPKKIEKIEKKTLFFNRFKEKESNNHQSSK
jgi:hypothetical protein